MWKRVIAPTALVSVLWVLVSCGTSYLLSCLDEAQTQHLHKSRNVIQAAGEMQENLWRLQALLLHTAEVLRKGEGWREHLETDAVQAEAAFDQSLAGARNNCSTADEESLVGLIEANFEQYRRRSRRQIANGGISPQETAQAVDTAMQLASTVAESCDQLSDVAQRLANEAFVRRDQLRSRVNFARFGFIIVGPAIGILLGIWVARGLHHSISEISVTLRDASGDLEQEIGRVEVSPAEELGDLPSLQRQVQYISGRIKHVVEQLQSARREAVHSERLAAVGALAAGVAHEVRNPLTSVKLLIQAIERNQAPDCADKHRLGIVRQELARIEATMQELLDYARPPKLRRVRHDVREPLRRALTLAAARAEQNEIIIDEQLGDAPASVDGDPDQLQQVFVNLLLNAVEAMSTGGSLSVAVEEPPPDNRGGLLRIVFRDTGSGIRSDVMERLFEPFVTSKECGIGLGLAISRQIMLKHGGKLTACNQSPAGAMFVVEVPLAASQTAECLGPPVAIHDMAANAADSEIWRAEATKTADY